MSGPAARCEFISTRQGVHFTNTCLAGQIDNDGVEAHSARLGWACEQQRAGLCQWRCCGSVPCAETRAFRAASKPRRKFCSLRVPSPKFLNWPRSSPPADHVPCRAPLPQPDMSHAMLRVGGVVDVASNKRRAAGKLGSVLIRRYQQQHSGRAACGLQNTVPVICRRASGFQAAQAGPVCERAG
jgi:hypothetical protein